MSDSEDVLYHVEDGVGVITYNRPHVHNALRNDTVALYQQVLNNARNDDSARVLLLQGAGKSFCSGRDTTELGDLTPGMTKFQHLDRSLQRKLEFTTIQKPIIAAVHGYAIGGGFEIALGCDIRVVAADAKLSLPEIDHGIMADAGGTVRTAILAGSGRAMYLTMTGRQITGQRAYEWGLADFVHPADEVHAFALDIAKCIASKQPLNIQLAKQMINEVSVDVVRRGLRQEAIALTAIYETEDYEEFRSARSDGRRPSYRGR